MEIQGLKNSPKNGDWQSSLDRGMPKQLSPQLKKLPQQDKKNCVAGSFNYKAGSCSTKGLSHVQRNVHIYIHPRYNCIVVLISGLDSSSTVPRYSEGVLESETNVQLFC